MSLAPCPACRRHVVATAPRCVFCGAGLSGPRPAGPALRGRLSRAAVFSAGLATSACWSGTASAPGSVEAPQVVAANGVIEGTVVSSNRQAFDSWKVTLTSPDGAVRSTLSDAAGRFRFDALPPGRYAVAWDSSLPHGRIPIAPAQGRQEVEVSEGRAAQVELVVNVPTPQLSPNPMPYGAPPARRRVV